MNDKRAPVEQDEHQCGDANREGFVNGPTETLGDREETKEPKVHNPRELNDARYAALDCRAHSDQARALVAAVTDLAAAQEISAGKRTNKRKKKQIALSSAVERFLADLLQEKTSEK